MHPILRHVDDKLGPPPRRLTREEWADLQIPRPKWMDADDMAVIYDDLRLLFTKGEVVWGHMVQANQLVLGPGPRSCPATVIYSRHPEVMDDPAVLGDVAHRVSRFKSQGSDDPDERRYGQMLANERQRAMRWRVPESVADGLPVYSTTVMVCRKHVPGRILAKWYFPLLRHPDTVATVIVPYWFWPRSFRDEWADRAAAIADNSPWIRVTPESARTMEKIAREDGQPRDWALRLWIERATDGGLDRVRDEFDRDYDPRRDRLFESNGMRVVVDRRDAAELRGFVIDLRSKDNFFIG